MGTMCRRFALILRHFTRRKRKFHSRASDPNGGGSASRKFSKPVARAARIGPPQNSVKITPACSGRAACFYKCIAAIFHGDVNLSTEALAKLTAERIHFRRSRQRRLGQKSGAMPRTTLRDVTNGSISLLQADKYSASEAGIIAGKPRYIAALSVSRFSAPAGDKLILNRATRDSDIYLAVGAASTGAWLSKVCVSYACARGLVHNSRCPLRSSIGEGKRRSAG